MTEKATNVVGYRNAVENSHRFPSSKIKFVPFADDLNKRLPSDSHWRCHCAHTGAAIAQSLALPMHSHLRCHRTVSGAVTAPPTGAAIAQSLALPLHSHWRCHRTASRASTAQSVAVLAFHMLGAAFSQLPAVPAVAAVLLLLKLSFFLSRRGGSSFFFCADGPTDYFLRESPNCRPTSSSGSALCVRAAAHRSPFRLSSRLGR